MTVLRYTLPFPPSVNNLFVNKGNRRIVSPGYAKWRTEAGEEISAQRARQAKNVKGNVSVAIYAVRPDKRRRDIDNLCKAILDLLVSMHVIDDDSAIQRLTVEWSDAASFECMVLVQPHVETLAA